MKKLLLILSFVFIICSLFSQTKNDSIKLKSKWKYEIGMALGTSVISYPLVPTYNLEFGATYQRWKFKFEPKVSYVKDKFNYGLTAKIGFVLWKSK